MNFATGQPPLILHEDEHLLVIGKPAGWNTHAPAPFAGEGVYDWLRHREPRWAALAIVHRLDKETSGVLVFGKTTAANRSLADQFASHAIQKKYLLQTDRPVTQTSFTAVSSLVRSGEKYLSRPLHAGAARAETRFRVVRAEGGRTLVEAEPVTGRTHQIRVHAAEHGFPILGDTLYGDTSAPRLCLHAESLTLKHPDGGVEMTFRAPVDFAANAAWEFRRRLIDAEQTNAFRLIHGASDGWPGWYADQLGDHLLSQSEPALTDEQRQFLRERLDRATASHGLSPAAYHKILDRQVRQSTIAQTSSQLVLGPAAPDRFVVRENGVQFELSFNEGHSVGLFPDQRDNRRRFLMNHVAADFPLFPGGAAGREVLNTFAYTCGFSVCAALAGARATSLDLSKKYLEWGRRNFALNGLDPAAHDFIYGDVFDWLRRLTKKGRAFDVIVLDPPTFSQSKEHGVFRVEKDFGKLVAAALALLKPDGALLASTNAAKLEPEKFLELTGAAITAAHRKIIRQHYVPQPPDFPISQAEPAYLKTVWLRIG